MRDKELYTAILGVVRPWVIVDVELDAEDEQVPVRIDCHGSAVPCPECGTDCPRHDHVSGAERKIAFDHFHMAKRLGEAVNGVARKNTAS